MALIPGTNIPVPEGVTPFSSVLPFEKIFQQDLIDQMGYDQVAPDLLRSRNKDLGNYARGQAQTGGYRTGQSQVGAQDLRDQYQRQIAEQQADFGGQVKDWMTDWYNRQAQDYYQTPSRWATPALPDWKSVMGDMGIASSGPSSELQDLQTGGWTPQGGFQSSELGQQRTPQSRMSELQKQTEVNPLMGSTPQPLSKGLYSAVKKSPVNLAGAYQF